MYVCIRTHAHVHTVTHDPVKVLFPATVRDLLVSLFVKILQNVCKCDEVLYKLKFDEAKKNICAINFYICVWVSSSKVFSNWFGIFVLNVQHLGNIAQQH